MTIKVHDYVCHITLKGCCGYALSIDGDKVIVLLEKTKELFHGSVKSFEVVPPLTRAL